MNIKLDFNKWHCSWDRILRPNLIEPKFNHTENAVSYLANISSMLKISEEFTSSFI